MTCCDGDEEEEEDLSSALASLHRRLDAEMDTDSNSSGVLPHNSMMGETVLRFPTEDIYFHTDLSEQLLARLCDCKKLTDLIMTLFDAGRTRLRSVKLRDASKLTKSGLRVLKGHNITELEARGLKGATVSDLVSCLNEWTLTNLKHLNVANSTFVDQNKYTIVVTLSKLRAVTALNVSGTEFNKTSLEMVVDDLPLLKSLDISNTKVSSICALKKCKNRLKSLAMYGLMLPGSASDVTVAVLAELHALTHLDISVDKDDLHPFDMISGRMQVEDLLVHTRALPLLTSLDISGKELRNVDVLATFLRYHPDLKFMGLMLTDTCKHDVFVNDQHMFYSLERVVSGCANEAQILEALRRYIQRPQYITKALYHLFRLTQCYTEPREDVIKLVLDAARNYPSVFSIQMAATACLYHLSRGAMGNRLHIKVLGDIVKTALDAMEAFPTHQQLQKNILLTICCDRILQKVNFDRYKCARLAMDCLCTWQDNSMNKMSVAICSILAAHISTSETSELGSQSAYMNKLLSLVRSKMEDGAIDVTLKFTLSALWNLTDESPRTCSVFLSEGGMELFMDVLNAFPGEMAVEAKILGLLNNIAEVKELRSHLMVDGFLEVVSKLMYSPEIEVSYFAAGIVAHLASDDAKSWTTSITTKGTMTAELANIVSGWIKPKKEMVAYRSFRPFFPLMAVDQHYSVQLWAVWAIHHVCFKNAVRYCPMLMSQGVEEIMLNLFTAKSTHPEVRRLTGEVVASLHKQSLISAERLQLMGIDKATINYHMANMESQQDMDIEESSTND